MQQQAASEHNDPYFDDLCGILRQTLQLPSDYVLTPETGLLGAIAEFDSMSVVTVLTELEDQFGFVVDDDEISAETFESIGTLLHYIQAKIKE